MTHVVQTGNSEGKPAFKTIEFTDSRAKGQLTSVIGSFVILTASRRLITAEKEVILSAGVVGTPFILMHSGIGDSADLTRVGITPIVHLPSVGRNLSDHAVVGNMWPVNSTDALETLVRDPVVATNALNLWETNRTGPLVDIPFNQVGWLRVQNGTDVFSKLGDPSSGPKSAHFEMVIEVRRSLLDFNLS